MRRVWELLRLRLESNTRVQLTLTEEAADRLEKLGNAYIDSSYPLHLAHCVFDAAYHGSKELYDVYSAYEVGRGIDSAAEAGKLIPHSEAERPFAELPQSEIMGKRDLW